MIESILDLNQGLPYSFSSQSVFLLIVVGLQKRSMDRAFENIKGIVSPSYFELVSRTHAMLLESLQSRIFPLSYSRKEVYEARC